VAFGTVGYFLVQATNDAFGTGLGLRATNGAFGTGLGVVNCSCNAKCSLHIICSGFSRCKTTKNNTTQNAVRVYH